MGGGSSGLFGGALCSRLLGLLLSLLLGGSGGGGLLRSSSLGRGSLLFAGSQHKVLWHHTFQEDKTDHSTHLGRRLRSFLLLLGKLQGTRGT